MLARKSAPTGPARPGAKPPVFPVAAIDDPALPEVLTELAAVRADELDADDTVNRRWAMRSNHMPTVTIPHRSTGNPIPLAQHQRLSLLRQAVDRNDIPLQDRVAAALVLLYAQPLTRITRLTIDDVLR
ncbi:hypothetical protein [Streptomyces sp. 35G-GA-8]|uniref:hypothetical protein n=1 Tax=Streptomyces sp. 35G-GA-8 TaxID=2939434 RepID=UPI00201FB1E7|nr:hypothetical protein [Streptomyces sp. 35G-GA-8]MCL7380431.1 hypothetical protein [Streptomyces sp. 35G-GA-8]